MNRDELCKTTSRKLGQLEHSARRALVGFDGFVDEIIAVVDKRHDHARYEPLRTIGGLGAKISAAAGQSSNYELVVRKQKLGGNGPIMANALATLGMGVTYVGNLGRPTIHPVFEEFSKRAEVISIAEPAHTDALEFEDGKLMLGKLTALADVSWENLLARVGHQRLVKLIGDARLIGMVNWTMLPHMSEIWRRMIDEILPSMPKRERTLFVDLADPEKRSREDLEGALRILSQFQKHLDVILGLNLKEADQVAGALGIAKPAESEADISRAAKEIRSALSIGCVVIHPRAMAAAAHRSEIATIAGPFVQQPAISTGAGDHFNAGFCVAQIAGLSLDESLCAGVGASGCYVRTGFSPTAQQLSEFVASMPSPE